MRYKREAVTENAVVKGKRDKRSKSLRLHVMKGKKVRRSVIRVMRNKTLYVVPLLNEIVVKWLGHPCITRQ
jgi:hypothetical protein